MSLPTLGVFTPYTLMLHEEATGESPAAFFKRSLVLFDQLMLIPDGMPMSGKFAVLTKDRFLEMMGRGEAFTGQRDFQDLVVLRDDLLEEVRKLKFEDRGSEDDLWGGENGDRFIKYVEQLVDSQIAASGGKLDESASWDMNKHYIGNISSDYHTLKLVTKLGGEYSGLFSDLHEAAAKATLGIGTPAPDPVARSIGDANIFDFGALSWVQIMELRRSGYCESFRAWANDWITEYQETSDSKAFEEKLREAMEEAKFAVIGMTEPKVAKTVLGAIAGNLPIPVVNPVSVVSGIASVKAAVEKKRDYGWLFFVQRAYKAANQVEGRKSHKEGC